MACPSLFPPPITLRPTSSLPVWIVSMVLAKSRRSAIKVNLLPGAQQKLMSEDMKLTTTGFVIYIIRDPCYNGSVRRARVSYLPGLGLCHASHPGHAAGGSKLAKHRNCLTTWELQALPRRAPLRLLSSNPDACDKNRLSGQGALPRSSHPGNTEL